MAGSCKLCPLSIGCHVKSPTSSIPTWLSKGSKLGTPSFAQLQQWRLIGHERTRNERMRVISWKLAIGSCCAFMQVHYLV